MGDSSWVGPVVQAAGGVVGSFLKQDAAGTNQKLMEDAYRRALAMLQSGELSYTPAQAGMLGPSAMNGVEADPESIMAQKEALHRLQGAATEGYNSIDRAAINRAMGEANQQERSQREAALARLDPNSGAAMAARLSAQQSGANRANQAALDIAAGGRMKALQSLGMLGSLSSHMRGQSFDEGAARGLAEDAISRFNGELSRFNAGAQNAAAQNGINNKLGAMGIATGATGALAGANTALGNARAGTAQGIGNAVGNGINAFQNKPGDGNTSGDTPSNGKYDEPAGPEYRPDLMEQYGDYPPIDDEDRYS